MVLIEINLHFHYMDLRFGNIVVIHITTMEKEFHLMVA